MWLCFVFAAMVLAMFAFSFRDTLRGFRETFLPKSFRFRLRTLLIAASVVQLVIAMTAWLSSDSGGPAAALDSAVACLLLAGPMLCLVWLLAADTLPRKDVFRHRPPPPGYLDDLATGQGKAAPVPPPVADPKSAPVGRRKRRWWKRRCGPASVGQRLWTSTEPPQR
jgi:hypothetical protein